MVAFPHSVYRVDRSAKVSERHSESKKHRKFISPPKPTGQEFDRCENGGSRAMPTVGSRS